MNHISGFFSLLLLSCGVSAASAGVTPPFEPDFASTGLEGWTIIDANGDGEQWFYNERQDCLQMNFNLEIAMDDWLITPALTLEAGKSYNLTFKGNGSQWDQELLEVKMGRGNTVDDMKETLIAPTLLDQSDYQALSAVVVPDADGDYYIGFHGISDPAKFYLRIKEIKLSAGKSAQVPAAVSGLTAEADPDAALKCIVSFTAPSKSVDDETLTSLVSAIIERDGEQVKVIESPAPGSRIEYEDILPKGGEYTYTVSVTNALGASTKESVKALVGFDLPEGVANPAIERAGKEGFVKVSWRPVVKDVRGRTLTEDDVTYSVCVDTGSEYRPVVEGVKGSSVEFRAVEEGKQELVTFAVFPFTTAGPGTGGATPLIPAGTPYEDLAESFVDGDINYVWSQRVFGELDLELADDFMYIAPSSDGDNGYLMASSEQIGAGFDFISGLVKLDSLNPTLEFYTYNYGNTGEEDINEISVSVLEDGDSYWDRVYEARTVADICDYGRGRWGKVTVPLDGFAGKTVQFEISASINKVRYVAIDNITVKGVVSSDLAVTAKSVPPVAFAGSDIEARVEVRNVGALEMKDFTVELYKGDLLMASAEGEALGRGEAREFNFPIRVSALAGAPEDYSVKVSAQSDEVAENDRLDFTVKGVATALPAAENLGGEPVDGGVRLFWTAPVRSALKAETVTESFEEAVGFDASYPGWIFVDRDENPVFTEETIPGIRKYVDRGSWWVWNNEVIDWNMPVHKANSGEKYLFAAASRNGSSDNWAISPELSGDTQIITFFAQSRMWTYPEAIEVYWSEGSIDPADFKMVTGSAVNPVAAAWTEYFCRLPQGAKRFAIRSHADDAWALMLDDVTYEAANPADFAIAGYNLYRDGRKINVTPLSECEFVDLLAPADADVRYDLTVEYQGRGESAPVSFATHTASLGNAMASALTVRTEPGRIVIGGVEDEVSVVSADGKVIFAGLVDGNVEVEVSAGIYLIKTREKTFKTIVK